MLELKHIRSGDDSRSDDEEGSLDLLDREPVQDERGVGRGPVVVTETPGELVRADLHMEQGRRWVSASRPRGNAREEAESRFRTNGDIAVSSVTSASPPSSFLGVGRSISRARTGTVGDREVRNLGHVDLGEPLLHLGRVNGRCLIEWGVDTSSEGD
jgi:hypothetical protein